MLRRNDDAVMATDRYDRRRGRREAANGVGRQAQGAALLMIQRHLSRNVGRRIARRMAEVLGDIEPGDGVPAEPRWCRSGPMLPCRQQRLQQNGEYRQLCGWPVRPTVSTPDHGIAQ